MLKIDIGPPNPGCVVCVVGLRSLLSAAETAKEDEQMEKDPTIEELLRDAATMMHAKKFGATDAEIRAELKRERRQGTSSHRASITQILTRTYHAARAEVSK